MRYSNPIDFGAHVFNPLDDLATRRTKGVHNRTLLRAMLDDPARRRRIYTGSEKLYVELDQPQPGGWLDQTPGPWLLMKSDVEFVGDDPEASGLIIGSSNPLLELNGLRVQHPYSLQVDNFSLECVNPMTALASPKSVGISIVSRQGDFPNAQFVELNNIKTRDWAAGVMAVAGASNSPNYMHLVISGRRTDIQGQLVGVAVYTDPNGGGRKSLHVERGVRVGTKKDPWSSHAVYVHALVNLDVDGAQIYGWRTADYGIQQWGAGAPGQKNDYARVRNTVFEASGDGFAMITGVMAPTQMDSCRVNSRCGVQARNDLQISNVLFSPQAPVVNDDPNHVLGTASMVGPYTNDKCLIQASNLMYDGTEAGPTATQLFSVLNSGNVEIRASQCIAYWKPSAVPGRKPPTIVMVGGASKLEAPFAKTDLQDCYILTPDDLLNTSASMFFASRQGTHKFTRCGHTGDAVHDRGSIRLDGDLTGLQRVELYDCDFAGLTRGSAVYVAPGVVDKLVGAGNKFGLQRLIGSAQLRLRAGEAPAALPHSSTLILSPDFDTYRLAPSGVPVPPPIVKIQVGAVDSTPAFAATSVHLWLVEDTVFQMGAGNVGFNEMLSAGVVKLTLNPVTMLWELG